VIQHFPSGCSEWSLAEGQPNPTTSSVRTVCFMAVRFPRSSKCPKRGYSIC
jgi:hypothetical protein